MNKRETRRFLRGDKLSKLQGKTIMLIWACSHQSSNVNAVAPCDASGHRLWAVPAETRAYIVLPITLLCWRAIALRKLSVEVEEVKGNEEGNWSSEFSG